MRVLIVEDDETMSTLLERGLKEEGDAVVVERSGIAAIGIARSHAFDVIILDVM